MKIKKIYLIIFCWFFINNACFGQNISGLESPTEIVQKIEDFWKNSDMDGLGIYLGKLYESHPKYIPAIIGASFLDFVYEGALESAKEKLDTINKTINLNPHVWSEIFVQEVNQAIKGIEMEMRLHKEHGRTKEYLKKNASSNKYREIGGSNAPLPPRLEMIRYCPFPWIEFKE